MKAVIITLAIASLASAASLDAQILSTRLPTPSTSRGTTVNGSWQVVGRDANGYTIYERRTSDRNGNIVIQRARREANGNMTIISSRTVASNDNRNNRNCDYNRTSNSVGDIIFGRTNDTYCDDNGSRMDGGWYQVGRGRDNNSIYERRTRDSSGKLVIQRARRNSSGTMTIINTRYASDNDKQWQKAEKKRQKEYRKEQKEQDKQYRKSQHDDNDDQRTGYVRGDDRYYAGSNAVARGNGNGSDKGKGKDHKNKH